MRKESSSRSLQQQFRISRCIYASRDDSDKSIVVQHLQFRSCLSVFLQLVFFRWINGGDAYR